MISKRLLSLAAVLVTAAAHAAPPANDSFASRGNLGSVASFSTSGSNVEASLEAGEPDFGGIAGSSVWYEWTAPASGWVTLTTAGSTLDTVIGVFTGGSVSTLTQTGFNDDSLDAVELGTDHFSRLQFFAVGGTSYKISVSGWYDSLTAAVEGSFTLSLTPVVPAFAIGGISLTPDPVNITNAAAAMTLNLTAASPGSSAAMTVRMHPASDPLRTFTLDVGDAQRVSGTAASGAYQLAFTLPRYLPGGNWFATVLASDGVRETQWSHGGDDIQDDYAFPATADPVLAVTNTGFIDSAPPVLASLTATPSTINAGTVTETGRVITFTLQITDNLAGFDSGLITLVSSGVEEPVAAFTSATRSGGDALDGTYTFTAVVPYGLATGGYGIRVLLQDASLFSTTYSSENGGSFSPLPSGSTTLITITGSDGYPAWAHNEVFITGQLDPSLDADADGAVNLLEYAFNLQPSTVDAFPLSAGTGVSGTPLITLQAGALRIEFIRRKASTGSGLAYQPQFSDTLLDSGPGSWTNASGTPAVTSIDGTWERVVITDTATGSAKRFARVLVTYTQP